MNGPITHYRYGFHRKCYPFDITAFSCLLMTYESLLLSNSTTVVLNRVSLFCSASGPERDSSEPDGPCLTGKFYDTTLTRATSSLLYSES